MATPLEDVLKGSTEEPKAEETPVEEPKEEPKGEPEPVEEPKAETPPAEPTKEVPLAALLDERDKRKSLQQQLEEKEKLLAEKEKDAIDFYADPDKAMSDLREQITNEIRTEYKRDLIAYSIENANARHDDYKEAFDAFQEAAKDNPALAEIAAGERDPGEYIYKTGKNFRQLDDAGGDVDALRERIRLEEREKILAELKDKDAKLKDVPQPITDETSASAPRDKVEGGPTPLESILRRNR